MLGIHVDCLLYLKLVHLTSKAEVTRAPKMRITMMVHNTALTSSWDFSYSGISGHT